MDSHRNSRNQKIPHVLVACIPILLSIITITQLQLNFLAMFLLTVGAYFAIYLKQFFIVSGETKSKLLNLMIWSLLVLAIFPFGCLIFLIINWEAFKGKTNSLDET